MTPKRTPPVDQRPPRCNRLCRPRLALYEAKCPRHGIKVLLDALTPACPALVAPLPDAAGRGAENTQRETRSR